MARRTGASHAPPASRPASLLLGMPELAHELNSLLDGSLRSVALAMRELQQRAASDADSQTLDTDDAVVRLRTAQLAMHQMARLLERAMSGSDSIAIGAQGQLLARAVEDVCRIVEPLARQRAVELTITIARDAQKLPAGPLSPVLMNGLRNAVQAAAQTPSPRLVTLAIEASKPAGTLLLRFNDSGQGLAADAAGSRSLSLGGHGLGLEISRRIVEALGGTLQLANRTHGRGAVLTIAIPLRSLHVDE